MAERDKILRYFKAGGDEALAARLVDLAEAVRKTGKYKVSEFLDPHGRNVAEIVAANFEGIRLESDGGFVNAERTKAAFVADNFYGTPDFGLVCYLVTWDKRYYTLSHRDILGAFMGMGCEREIMGDIVLAPEGAQFVADKAFANYIESNLTRIGSAYVTGKGRKNQNNFGYRGGPAVGRSGGGRIWNQPFPDGGGNKKPEREAELERSKERVPVRGGRRCDVVPGAGPGRTDRDPRHDEKGTLCHYAETVYIN